MCEQVWVQVQASVDNVAAVVVVDNDVVVVVVDSGDD